MSYFFNSWIPVDTVLFGFNVTDYCSCWLQEKFLQLFSREAYASAYIDNKKYTGYNHLCTASSSSSS